MYLSSIPVETGNDPTRPRPGRVWVSNPYRIHQRLCMAFDHIEGEERVLFRVEGPVATRQGMRPRILVQSLNQPDWDSAFRNAPFLVAGADAQCPTGEIAYKPYEPHFEAGDRCRYLLHANPTVKKDGRRHGIVDRAGQLDWLKRKAAAGGFACEQVEVESQRWQYSRRSWQRDLNRHVHFAVTFSGILRVTDSEKFAEAVAAGIGPAKAYGFGLLSVAPAPA